MPVIPRLPRRNTKTERIKERQSFYSRKDYRQQVDWYKREHIWCENCLKNGIYTPGTDLHHIQSVFDRDLTKEQQLQRLYDHSNWVLLCPTCHRMMHGTASKEEIDDYNNKINKK